MFHWDIKWVETNPDIPFAYLWSLEDPEYDLALNDYIGLVEGDVYPSVMGN